jgi:hypothetical protein
MSLNLKQARSSGKLEQFVIEREAGSAEVGDEAAFNRAVQSMAGKSLAVPKASKKACPDD